MIKRILVSILLFALSFFIVYLSVVFITFDFNIENLKIADRLVMLYFIIIIGVGLSMLYLFEYDKKK